MHLRQMTFPFPSALSVRNVPARWRGNCTRPAELSRLPGGEQKREGEFQAVHDVLGLADTESYHIAGTKFAF